MISVENVPDESVVGFVLGNILTFPICRYFIELYALKFLPVIVSLDPGVIVVGDMLSSSEGMKWLVLEDICSEVPELEILVVVARTKF